MKRTTRIVRIGNSRGIRIPKVLLDTLGFGEEVEMVQEGDRLILTRSRSPRDGWAEAFQSMAQHGDDRLLDDDGPATEWDEDEWEW